MRWRTNTIDCFTAIRDIDSEFASWTNYTGIWLTIGYSIAPNLATSVAGTPAGVTT